MKPVALSSICVCVLLSLCLSSCESTEKYAKKEYGKEFNIWHLNYEADADYVYWPRINFNEGSITGSLYQIKTTKHEQFFSSKVTTYKDTTSTDAYLQMGIKNSKSKLDAKRYFTVIMKVLDSEKDYWDDTKQTVEFYVGNEEPIIFESETNSSGLLTLDRDCSEKVLSLLCGRVPITVKFSFTTSSYDFLFSDSSSCNCNLSFIIEGSPKLTSGLKLLEKRQELAEKESRKQ